MGKGLNKAMIIGFLGKAPTISYTESGSTVANMSVATKEKWKDKSGVPQERSEWHRVVAFGKLGEICQQHLVQGAEVFFEGRLTTRKWQDKEGVTRYSTEIVAHEMQVLGRKDRALADDSGRQKAHNDNPEDPPY